MYAYVFEMRKKLVGFSILFATMMQKYAKFLKLQNTENKCNNIKPYKRHEKELKQFCYTDRCLGFNVPGQNLI